VELVAALTIWGMFSCYLLFPLAGLPARMHRTAMTLLVAELVALAMWSYGSQGCEERPCAAQAELGRTAASVDIPLLAVALVALAVVIAVRRLLRQRRADQRAPSEAPAGSGSRDRGTRAAA
jgi:hypothetical protein